MKACDGCTEFVGNFKNPPPQFNCSECWDIVQKEIKDLREALRWSLGTIYNANTILREMDDDGECTVVDVEVREYRKRFNMQILHNGKPEPKAFDYQTGLPL